MIIINSNESLIRIKQFSNNRKLEYDKYQIKIFKDNVSCFSLST